MKFSSILSHCPSTFMWNGLSLSTDRITILQVLQLNKIFTKLQSERVKTTDGNMWKAWKYRRMRSLREISCEIKRLKAIRRNGHWFRREKESRKRSWNGVILPARSAGSVDLFPFSFPFVFSSLHFAGQSLLFSVPFYSPVRNKWTSGKKTIWSMKIERNKG